MSEDRILNMLTIDLEDWYQLTGWVFQQHADPLPETLERQTRRLLDLLDRHQCRATFFCLGKSLDDCPDIVRMVADHGHEIASHGCHHERISRVGLDVFREDLLRSLDWLNGLLDRPILGYRAPCFSVTSEQLGRFFEICLEAGLQYDSSVYPFAGQKYGIETALRSPYQALTRNGRQLMEFPVATVDWLGRRWPMAGGGWWRLLPQSFIRQAIARCNHESLPAVIYFHPYEFDTELLSVKRAVGSSLRARYWTLHQNIGRRSVYGKLDAILGQFRFGAIEDAMRETVFGDGTKANGGIEKS